MLKSLSIQYPDTRLFIQHVEKVIKTGDSLSLGEIQQKYGNSSRGRHLITFVYWTEVITVNLIA